MRFFKSKIVQKLLLASQALKFFVSRWYHCSLIVLPKQPSQQSFEISITQMWEHFFSQCLSMPSIMYCNFLQGSLVITTPPNEMICFSKKAYGWLCLVFLAQLTVQNNAIGFWYVIDVFQSWSGKLCLASNKNLQISKLSKTVYLAWPACTLRYRVLQKFCGLHFQGANWSLA